MDTEKGGSKYSEVDADEAIINIGILVLNDDQTCQSNVAEVLQRCKYQVLHTGTVYDALHAIWENKDRLNLVITNAHKLKLEGLAIIENVRQKLKLEVLLMENDERIEPRGELFSFSAYALNDLSKKRFGYLLECARQRTEEDKMAAENGERASISNAAAAETNKASSSTDDEEPLNQKRKATGIYGEESEDSRCNHHKRKKRRVNWTAELHQKFEDAVDVLKGHERIVPKKIVEVMGIPWLTREHVASHLQKFRLSSKDKRNELEGLGVLTSPTASRLASFQTFFSQTSYIPTFKQSILPYTTINKDLSIDSTPGRKLYALSDDRSGVDKLRDMAQCRDESSSSSKFVGYRFEGNKIDFGPVKKISTDALLSPPARSGNQSTSYVQHHPVSDQNIVGGGCIPQQSCLLGTEIAAAADTCEEPDLLSSYIHQHPPTLSSITCEEPRSYVRQSWDTTANASTTSHHQDLLLPSMEATGNDFTEQSSAAFVDDILQQNCCPSPPLPQMFQDLEICSQSGNDDDSLISGTGNACDEFDFLELDNTFFSRDY